MAGELWLQQVRVAKEVTQGVPVTPATRRLYLMEPSLVDEGEASFHEFATATPDNVREVTAGAKVVGGRVQMPVSDNEMLEFLSCTLKGNVSPSTPAGGTLTRDWVFTPDATLNYMTMEYDDGARAWQGSGIQGAGFEIAGAVGPGQANLATFDLIGLDLIISALTGAPSERIPTFMEGWETKFYLGAFGTDPATLDPIHALLKNWRVRVARNPERKYLGNNTQSATEIVQGKLTVESDITIEAKNAQAVTEFNNWRAATKRMMRLEFGQNKQIEASPTNEVQTLTEGTAMTAGNYTLTFRGQTTGNIAFNATAAQIQAALEALPTIGKGNVQVTGGGVDTAPATITFIGQLAGMNVPQLTSNQAGLTGTFTHATTTPGVGYKRAVFLDLPGAWRSIALGESDAGSRMYRLMHRYIYDPTNAFGFRITCRGDRTATF